MNTVNKSVLLICMLSGLTACGGGSDPDTDATSSSNSSSPTTISETSAKLAANGNYVIANDTSEVTLTLPDTSSLSAGDSITLTGRGAGGWKITQADGQSIVTTAVTATDLNGMAGAVWTARESVRDWTAVATSADGSKMVAAAYADYLFASDDTGVTWTALESAGKRNWISIASSSDRTLLVAADKGGYLYTSSNSGQTWTARATDATRNWYRVAVSADSSRIIAGEEDGGLFSSTDAGATWTQINFPITAYWRCFALSSNGKTIAAGSSMRLYTSTDAGTTWVTRDADSPHAWSAVALSSDGKQLVASAWSGAVLYTGNYLYTANIDADALTAHLNDTPRVWSSLATSQDGTRIAAIEEQGNAYTSTDSGATWISTKITSATTLGGIAASANAHHLVASASQDYLYTSDLTGTTAGSSGSLAGTQGVSVTLIYQGNGVFVVKEHSGTLSVH